ncbi:uncharacterized protein LOC102799676 [Neolamprologus brichardi]|uniref:uncharacterized protein LOC102799676 n=1 Tax=Neolamprologus brichardi TaxID=32507 RepID=UPI0016439585|nr:uncharacterized protein LOC102799676 [Neolamprologus brichardi]
MDDYTNRRGTVEHFKKYVHLKLDDLREVARASVFGNQYIFKMNIPEYPKPEFHVSHLKHDTGRESLCQVYKDGGFKDPLNGAEEPDKLSLVWWSLAVAPEEILSAERMLLENTFPHRTEEQAHRQQNFLMDFATSPAFGEKSRYGSYRFTFMVQEVLKAYSEQFCSGMLPVMRVFKTSLYKQEVMYAVLVHSPDDDEAFKQYPKLVDDPKAVCAYRDGRFIWTSEAMCETHRYELRRDEENNLAVVVPSCNEYYVWDNVALALYVKSGQVLKFDSHDLKKNLSICERAQGVPQSAPGFDTAEEARKLVTSLGC